MPENNKDEPADNGSSFLSLPAEIRNKVYEFVATADLEAFVERMTKPGLLLTSKQLRREYIDIFFRTSALHIDAYNGPSDGWQQIRDPSYKCVVFERGTFLNLTGFWSLGSTRRYCQREYSNYQGNVQNGIMTIRLKSGMHRWQWTCYLDY